MSDLAATSAQLASDTQSEDAPAPLATLVSLEREARAARDLKQLGFIAVNATHRLVEYYQCLLWCFTSAGKVKIQLVSGVAAIDRNSQAVLSLTRLVKALCAGDASAKLRPVTNADVAPKLRADWDEWIPQHGLWCPFVDRAGDLHAGLLITRETPFSSQEIDLLESLMDAYAHAWHALTWRQPSPNTPGRAMSL